MDYDHSIEIVTNLTELCTTDEEMNHPIRPCIKAAKRKLIEMIDEGSLEMDVKMKKMDTRMYSKYKADMDAYIKMIKDERAAMKEKKAKRAARRNAKNASKGQAKVLGFFGPDAEELKNQRENMTCKAGKNHRIRSCHNCSGCLNTNCGECTYCRDMKQFGGAGTRRQKCETRKCLKPQLIACDKCTYVQQKN